MRCAAFVRYQGFVRGTQGYKRSVAGTYCIDKDRDVSRDALSRMLETVRF